MLDLPHYLCNNFYLPWLSKGNRRTKTMQTDIGIRPSFPIPFFQLRRQFKVRGHAFDFISRPGSGSQRANSIAWHDWQPIQAGRHMPRLAVTDQHR